MYIIVHGALYQNCADLKVYNIKCVPKLVCGAWCMVHCTRSVLIYSLWYRVCTQVGAWCILVHCSQLWWFKVYHTRCVPKVMHGALHQNCAGLKSTIQSLYQSWCLVHGAFWCIAPQLWWFKVYHTRCVPKLMHGALHQNCADLKLKDLQSKITLILVASVLYSSCPIHCPVQVP